MDSEGNRKSCCYEFYVYYCINGKIRHQKFSTDWEALKFFEESKYETKILTDGTLTLKETGDYYKILQLKGQAYIDCNLVFICDCMYIVIWIECDEYGNPIVHIRSIDDFNKAMEFYEGITGAKAKILIHTGMLLENYYYKMDYLLMALGYFQR